MPMHGTKACVCGSVWGGALCLNRSCRCTVQGHRRLLRVQAMCMHSCVSWPQAGGCPVRPLLPLSVLLCFFTVGGCSGSQLSGLGISAPPWLARREARLPLGWAEPDRLPLPAQGGKGWGGGRQAIHLLLLQRNGAARPPAHLSSASFADNGHLSSLSSAPMSSAQLTDGGGGWGHRVHEHWRAHMHMGLLDTCSCTYTQEHGT